MSGVITISIEIELAWGIHDTGEFGRLSRDGSTEREYLSKLLSVTDESQVPISFNVVGHLFLNRCSGIHDGPHNDGWFSADPGTDKRTDGLFYAPGTISDITSTAVPHEVCTHTFSHVLFDNIPRDVCIWEIDRVQELHRKHNGQPITSLVPPRHQSPPYDVLTDYGIEVVRQPMKKQQTTGVQRFKELLTGPLPLSKLQKTDGVVETFCTTNPSLTAPALPAGQGETHPVFRPIPVSLCHHLHLKKLKRATKAAIENSSHLHLWCHLFDLSNPQQFSVVRAYLEWLGSFSETSEIVLATMDELPEYV